MKAPYNLTKHNWPRSKQWQKFLEELEEFSVEIEMHHKGLGNHIKLVDEGFDTIKSLLKCDHNEETKIIDISIPAIQHNTLKEFFGSFKKRESLIDEKNTNYSHGFYVIATTEYLYKFCQENNLNFSELLKKNDLKNAKKGVMKKVYLSEEDIEMLTNISHYLKVENMPKHRNYLKSIINRIEE